MTRSHVCKALLVAAMVQTTVVIDAAKWELAVP
jgi:hypothetical protein